MLDTAELVGPSPELEVHLRERREEKQQLLSDLAEIDSNLNGQQLEISNEALVYLAGQLSEILQSGSPDQVRTVLRGTVQKAELYREKVRVYYAPPLGWAEFIGNTCLNTVPPWRFELQF